jgi:hypothetical protein
MNDRLLAILAERPDFNASPEDKKRLDFFVEYLDHGSLFMVGFEPGADPSFTFTNDAQHYRFSLSDIRKHTDAMKSGQPMNWERIPFEYITRHSDED